MTPPLKLLGYWDDGIGSVWPHPRKLVEPMWCSEEEKDRLVRYLRSGLVVNEFLGYSYCRFSNGPPDCQMGCTERSDGVWVWPDGLHVYVAAYDVRLPEEFLQHARTVDFRLDDNLKVSDLEDVPVCSAYWEAWCRNEVSHTRWTSSIIQTVRKKLRL